MDKLKEINENLKNRSKAEIELVRVCTTLAIKYLQESLGRGVCGKTENRFNLLASAKVGQAGSKVLETIMRSTNEHKES